MKNAHLPMKFLAAFFVAAISFTVGCKPEKGMYNATPVISTTNLTTYDYLKSKPGVYDSLLMLVNTFQGMKSILTDSAVTLFAPANSSFQLAVSNLNDLRASRGQGPIYLSQLAAGAKGVTDEKSIAQAKLDSAALDTLVSMYIIRKLYKADDFSVGDGLTINAVRGGYPMHGQRVFADAEGFSNGGVEIIQFADTKRSLFVAKWALTTTSAVNIKTKNGIVHLLTNDHTFGFDEYTARMTFVPPPPVAWNLSTDLLFPYWPPASNYYDGQVSAGEIFKKALDGSVLTKFISNVDASNNYYPTMYWFPRNADGSTRAAVCNSYTMTTANDSKLYRDRDPRAFKIEATLDPAPWQLRATPLYNDIYQPNPNAVWVQLDVRQDQDWTTNYQQKIFDFVNNVAYTGYRLVILQVGTGSTSQTLFQISEWTMNLRSN